MKQQDILNYQTACTALLLSVADADEILEIKEIDTVNDIVKFYFELNENEVNILINSTQAIMRDSVGLFEYGRIVNEAFDKEDKIEFVKSIYEVAYSDGDLHYLEHHTIKKIANILNIEREDLILAKAEIRRYL